MSVGKRHVGEWPGVVRGPQEGHLADNRPLSVGPGRREESGHEASLPHTPGPARRRASFDLADTLIKQDRSAETLAVISTIFKERAAAERQTGPAPCPMAHQSTQGLSESQSLSPTRCSVSGDLAPVSVGRV